MGLDWTQIIITCITVLIGSGGVATLFSVKEKKTRAKLDNLNELGKSWQLIEDERRERIKELKEDLRSKDEKIDRLYADISIKRNELDDCRTEKVLSKILECKKVGCTEREPPISAVDLSSMNEIVKERFMKEMFDNVLAAVSQELELSESEILSHSHAEEIVDARHTLIYILYRKGLYASAIAKLTGFDRRTIYYAISSYSDRLQNKKLLRTISDRLLRKL